MKQTKILMGMPVTIEIRDPNWKETDFDEVFEYFKYIDAKFSPFKGDSEVSKINRNEINKNEYSRDMKKILKLCEQTKKATNGYFNIVKLDGKIDPSGLVKGWAIYNAARILKDKKYKKFYVDAGGDAEIVGKNWKWGIRNPFKISEIVKVLDLSNCGIATSGTYERGQHIYDPVNKKNIISDIVSLTVIGKNVYEADRFSTPAFAMGRVGIEFIEKLLGFEGYMIDRNGVATSTTGFNKYIKK